MGTLNICSNNLISIHHDITKIRKIVLPGVDVVDVVDVEVDVAVVVVAVAEIIIKI